MGTQELAYTPMYPVVNSQPTLGACFRNMGFGDYVRLVFGTGLGATVGFVGGACALNDALLPVPIWKRPRVARARAPDNPDGGART